MYQVLAVVVIWLMLFVPLIVIGTKSQRKAPFIVAALMGLLVGGCLGTFGGLLLLFVDMGDPPLGLFPDGFIGDAWMVATLNKAAWGAMPGALIGAYIGGIICACPAARERGSN